MANPKIIIQSATATSDWATLNTHVTPMNVSFAVVVSGPVTYTVNVTYDDINQTVSPLSQTAASATQWPITALTSQTTSQATVVTFPFTAANITKTSGTGSATLYILQAGLKQG